MDSECFNCSVDTYWFDCSVDSEWFNFSVENEWLNSSVDNEWMNCSMGSAWFKCSVDSEWFNCSVDSEWFDGSVDNEWFNCSVDSEQFVQCSPAGVPQLKPCAFSVGSEGNVCNRFLTLAHTFLLTKRQLHSGTRHFSHEFYHVFITVGERNPVMGLLKEPTFSKHIC